MLKELAARLKLGYATIPFPAKEPTLPERYRGRPAINAARCARECRVCVEVCPTGAIEVSKDGVRLDLGRCLFCGECETACPVNAIRFSREYRMAAGRRQDMVLSGESMEIARALDARMKSLLGRAFRLRQVSAGGCNACEADTNVLTTVVFDLGRFGIQFVASPRHADGILVTGPVTENMKLALLKTYEAVPAPKIVIAVGACAIAGGPYAGHKEVHDGVEGILPVDLYIPGCPPHPIVILDGLLRLLGRIKK
ncbi:MAG: NADH-quinone oxidoreductase subunit NuoB [Thermodesulfobacteriota bacterium]